MPDPVVQTILLLSDFTAYLLLTLLLVIILSHIITRVYQYSKPPLKLSQQSLVVITGGCMGIGKQMAIQIARKYHCRIFIVDCRKDLFDQVIVTLEKLESKPECYFCDLADDISVANFLKFLNEKQHKIDLFIHNAGIHIPKPVLQTSEKELLLQFKVNFLSPVKIIKDTIELLQNGHIAIIASMVALAHGGRDVAAYSSSKNALYSYVNSLRQQFKLEGRKTTISMGCPYLIKTGMFEGFKTRLDFLFQQLQPEYVARRLVKEFIEKKQICYVYEYEALLFKVVDFLPSQVLDLLSIKFNVSNFSSIRERHQQRVSKRD